eukprot:maker-scaffold48_size466083-snap-gene-1.22 protein:Tk05973 transcript:maker-scaffold48_size466083-snap-gene-1.22-mRNA-1 annotation:"salivary alkaline phosphatase"
MQSLALYSLVVVLVTQEVKSRVFPTAVNEDADYWYEAGKAELAKAEALAYYLGQRQFQRPKNVVIFIGDGMGLSTVTAARIHKGQTKFGTSGEESQLIWEHFPSFALSKTYNVDHQVSDSASTASAIFTGVKTNYKTLGFDKSIEKGNPDSERSAQKVESILTWAQQEGMKTGIVTNHRITHGTPAALYAHTADRSWECDDKIPKPNDVMDIGLQLVSQKPGLGANVIFGGGDISLRNPEGHPRADWVCYRQDGRDLVQEWQDHHSSEGKSFKFVQDRESLATLNASLNLDHVMGIFAPRHMDYEDKRDNSTMGQPSLKEMTLKAIELLQEGPKGYFLMVENGQIDSAHHVGKANRALHEVLVLDETVEAVLEVVDEEDTLVIVTADHGHGLTISGYPTRGNDIRGLNENDPGLGYDNMPYATLSYANGPGFANAFDENGQRVNLREVDTTDMDFQQPALLPLSREIHSGHDVGIWASGPMSYFFHGVHEQSYIGHVMGYSICSGPYRKTCKRHIDRIKYVELRSVELNSSNGPNLQKYIFTFTSIIFLLNYSQYTYSIFWCTDKV